MSDEEWFDVVDEQDRVVGRASRAEVHARNLRHRAVHLWLFRPNGRLLLQKRALHKDSAPGCWVSSCSGHLDCGEDYEGAARRELEEELGIPPEEVAWTPPWRKFPASPETGHEFVQVYLLRGYRGAVHPNPEEVTDLRWMAPSAVDRALREEPGAFARSFCWLWDAYRRDW